MPPYIENKQTNMVYMYLYLGKTNIQAGGHAPIPRKQTNTVYVFLYLKKNKYPAGRDMLLYLENKRTWSICFISGKTYTQPGGHAPIHRKQTTTVYAFLYLAKQIYRQVDMPPYIENKRTRYMCSYILQNKYTARWSCSHT